MVGGEHAAAEGGEGGGEEEVGEGGRVFRSEISPCPALSRKG